MEARQFMAVAALASYVPESGLLVLLKDSRLAFNLDKVKGALLEQATGLASLGQPVWTAIRSFCVQPGWILGFCAPRSCLQHTPASGTSRASPCQRCRDCLGPWALA
eukprot:15249500-Alexandrium_andersonii.AAC.1